MILITRMQCAKFNTKNCNDKTNFEGTNIEKLIRISWDQILKSPTNTLGNSFSCTDLIFTPQLNLVMKYGVQTCKLSSPDNLYKIQSENILPSILWKGSVTLLAYKHW